jgi:hypothetical protein
MSRLNPDKLTVEFKNGVTSTVPIIPRRYTLTHSDITADLFLAIGPDFDYDNITNERDDVLGEWFFTEEGIRYYVYLHVSGPNGGDKDELRSEIFHRELPLALESIRFGDRKFFNTHPELDSSPIVVYFLYINPKDNKAEYWGTFADYDITRSNNSVKAHTLINNHVLIDEKMGDVNGDGIPDKVSLYGDTMQNSDFISNIIIDVKYGQSETGADIITEVSGYRPTIFLGDFTKDGTDDILFHFVTKDWKFAAGINTFGKYPFFGVFDSDRYNGKYQYLAEFIDFYKVSIGNVAENLLFYLDISHKGYDYLSSYYDEKGELMMPVSAKVSGLEALIPVIGSEQDNYYDLLAIQRVIGNNKDDTLGYIVNWLSFQGKEFESLQMQVAAPGTDFINLMNR